jgi:phosphohistidine phosphatase SixA
VLYLIRHAKAGSRSAFKGDDNMRPLSEPGRRQAKALAKRLAPTVEAAGITTFYSSPSIRCIQTLYPLAKMVGAEVEADLRLAEGGDYIAVLDMLWSLPDGTVLCSHGDVIPETMGALERRGCEFTSMPDWRKASVWVLQRNTHGEIVRAESWPPPDADR